MSLIRFVPTEQDVLNDLVNQLDITSDQREQVIRENKKTAVIFNSYKLLEYFTTEMSKANIEVISQATASIGKLHEQYKNNKENCKS